MFKKAITLGLVSVGALSLTACGNGGEDSSGGSNSGGEGNSGESVTWKLGHLSDEDHVWHRSAEKFAEEVESNTDGQVNIEIYPNEELGGETELLNSIQDGTADMTISGETMENWAPEAALMAAPYAIRDEEHMRTVVEGEIGQEIESAISEEVGVTPLYYHMRAPRNLTSNEPINTPEDLSGFSMRIPNVPLFQSAWQEAGAEPQVMDFSEVFTGLQQGVIDGQENPVDLIHSAGFYEVQDYVNRTEHVNSWIYVVVGNEQLNELDEETQNQVMEAAETAQQYGQELYEEETAEYESMLKEEGMTFNNDVDTEAFKEAMQPAIEESLSEEQLDLYNRIVETE